MKTLISRLTRRKDLAMHATVELADRAADVLARIRSRAPRVHCITNSVAQAYTANMLLAAGAVPSMTLAAEEIAAFVAGADALLVNLGTLDGARQAAIELALVAARDSAVPWLLDPVFVERSPARAAFARSLVGRAPAVMRLNDKEFAALAETEAAGDAASRFARSHGTIVALTGAVDRVSDGAREVRIANGDPLMGRVTAMGCAGSALVAAALAVEADAFIATVSALAVFGVAGEVAALTARGPGSFTATMIDALYNLERADLRARMKVS